MKPLRLVLAATLAATALPALAIGHRADIAILDRATGTELPVHWHQGRAYVVGRPGNEYQVIVRNRRQEDVLAVVSVDGVNVLSGETASSRQGGYVLAPWERMDIQGWRKSLAETAAFYFTSLGDSYAGRTGRPANVGVIGVALFNRKARYVEPHVSAAPPPSPHPYAKERHEGLTVDSAAPAAGASSEAQRTYRHAPPAAPSALPVPAQSAPLGTGHGRRESSAAQYVEFERATSGPVETIAIYYDSYRNLVAQGVLSTPSPRDPNPFPTAFVPDPR